ncbi:MAG TPA: arginine--tRNA ligase [Ktedonobacteraceae bacterium]
MTIPNEMPSAARAEPQDIQADLREQIQAATQRYLVQEGLTLGSELLPIDLQFSAQASFGDYSMPVMAWSAKNRLARPPMVIAEALSELLRGSGSLLIAEITVTRPGFLNFRLHHPAAGRSIIERIGEAGAGFGHTTTGQGSRVVVEHTAINSNKAAHVGHLRNSCIGDTVVRMLRSQGYAVEAQNYIDDSGVQVADVVVGFTLIQQGRLHVPGGNVPRPDESFDYFCSRVYVAVGRQYEQQPELLELRRDVLHAIEQGEEAQGSPDYPAIAADLAHQIVQAHLQTMARLNISYDLLTWESAILRAGLWAHTFEMLRQRGVLAHPQEGPAAGCWLLPFGQETGAQAEISERMQDKILVRSDGTATYAAKDIANHLWKFGLTDDPALGVRFHYTPWGSLPAGQTLWTMRAPEAKAAPTQQDIPMRFGHAQRVINVIDVRQSYTQQVVQESLRRLGYTEQAAHLTHIGYEVVTLSRATAAGLGIDTSDGRSFYPMSGRKGIEIKADDLINAAVARMQEVESKRALSDQTAAFLAASAIRYFMIRFGLQQVIALDIDEVLRPNGETGVYLQYAYARANSILRRLRETAYRAPDHLSSLPAQLEQSEWELLRHLDTYPRRLARATDQLAPNMLASYAFELASHFSDFYEHTAPIVRESDACIKAFRAHLVRATVQVMGNVLHTLGFIPLEEI